MRCQQQIAAMDGVRQRAVMRGQVARPVGQHVEPVVAQPRQQRRGRVEAHVCGAQLDRQRQAIQFAANLRHGRLLVPAAACISGSLAATQCRKQFDGGVERQRRHGEALFLAQSAAAGGWWRGCTRPDTRPAVHPPAARQAGSAPGYRARPAVPCGAGGRSPAAAGRCAPVPGQSQRQRCGDIADNFDGAQVDEAGAVRVERRQTVRSL
jgi:hypothetical protein